MLYENYRKNGLNEDYAVEFDDGVNIDTSSDLRILRLRDGYYVVGEGMCIPVADRDEAREVIEEMKSDREG